MSTIAETLTNILTEKFSVPSENIRPEAKLNELGLDSLDLIEVLFEVEEKFDIRIPQDGAAMRTGTMQDLLDTITQLVEQKQAAPQAQTA
jgi:acyl carrier protein